MPVGVLEVQSGLLAGQSVVLVLLLDIRVLNGGPESVQELVPVFRPLEQIQPPLTRVESLAG